SPLPHRRLLLDLRCGSGRAMILRTMTGKVLKTTTTMLPPICSNARTPHPPPPPPHRPLPPQMRPHSRQLPLNLGGTSGRATTRARTQMSKVVMIAKTTLRTSPTTLPNARTPHPPPPPPHRLLPPQMRPHSRQLPINLGGISGRAMTRSRAMAKTVVMMLTVVRTTAWSDARPQSLSQQLPRRALGGRFRGAMRLMTRARMVMMARTFH
ncbi:hypothetical protein EIP91_006838, partial [Steccherinum ochraceum]